MNCSKKNNWKIKVVSIFSFLWGNTCYANELTFPVSLLSNDSRKDVDLSLLQKKDYLKEGYYMVDLYLNDDFIETEWMKLVRKKNIASLDEEITGCFTNEILDTMGLQTKSSNSHVDKDCINLKSIYHDAEELFDLKNMKMLVNIPQRSLHNRPVGWISPDRYDEGITSAIINYRYSGSKYNNATRGTADNFIFFNSGLNFDSWRVRNNLTWDDRSSNGGANSRFDNLGSYIETDIVDFQSRFTAGKIVSNSALFDSFNFNGISLETDDNQIPDSVRGFSPVINGTAKSNARVDILQNGNLIYQTFVPAGPFSINDVYSMGGGGNFNVIVNEKDGTKHEYIVPYSSLPLMKRSGQYSYFFSTGRLNYGGDLSPAFAQAGIIYGLPNDLTSYTGTQLSDKYKSVTLGSGLNLGAMGAASLDITYSNSILDANEFVSGYALRLNYTKAFEDYGTNFQMTASLYPSGEFYTLPEAFFQKNYNLQSYLISQPYGSNNYNGNNFSRDVKRNKLLAGLSQQLNGLGYGYIYYSHDAFMSNNKNSIQMGFSGYFNKINYSITYGYDDGSPKSNEFYLLSLSVPFEYFYRGNKGGINTISSSSAFDSDGIQSFQTGMRGSLGSNGNTSWGVSQGYDYLNRNSGSADVSYKSGVGDLFSGYSYGSHFNQLNIGVSGGVVIHHGGITFGRYLSDSNILVSTSGISDVKVNGYSAIYTDSNGYALIPYANAYHLNKVGLDPNYYYEDLVIDNKILTSIPTKGAISKVTFAPHTGISVLLHITHNGKPIPFGALSNIGDNVSIANENGDVFFAGVKNNASGTVKWGGTTCHFSYFLKDHKKTVNLQEVICR